MAPKQSSTKRQPSARRGTPGVQAVEIGLRIAMVLANAKMPLQLSEIAKLSGMTASKAHRYLVSLGRAGLTQQDPMSSRYDLAWGAIRMGMAALSRLDEVRAAELVLQKLSLQTGVSAYAWVWGDYGPVSVRRAEYPPPIIGTRIGSTIPTVNSATGRIFVAFLPEEVTAPVIKREHASGVRPTASGKLLNAKQFKELLATIRRDGIAYSQDALHGFEGIAAPVFDAAGQLVMAINFFAIAGKHDFGEASSLSNLLKSATTELSCSLGWAGTAT